jgi:hypothetical protein
MRDELLHQIEDILDSCDQVDQNIAQHVLSLMEEFCKRSGNEISIPIAILYSNSCTRMGKLRQLIDLIVSANQRADLVQVELGAFLRAQTRPVNPYGELI